MLTSDNITLRAMELNDAETLYGWENDTSIWHLSNTLTPFSKFTLEQYVMNAHQDIYTIKQLRLMIDIHSNTESNITVGAIDLFDFDPGNQRAGIGILIHKDYRGKGYASEALDMLINYAINKLNIHQLYCNIGAANTESLNLFKGKGFVVVGLKKEWVRNNGDWGDEYLLQLIPPI